MRIMYFFLIVLPITLLFLLGAGLLGFGIYKFAKKMKTQHLEVRK